MTKWMFDIARLKALRELQSQTPDKFAESVPCSRSTVMNWEAGRTSPSVAQLCAIANHYGVTPISFFHQVEEKR